MLSRDSVFYVGIDFFSNDRTNESNQGATTSLIHCKLVLPTLVRTNERKGLLLLLILPCMLMNCNFRVPHVTYQLVKCILAIVRCLLIADEQETGLSSANCRCVRHFKRRFKAENTHFQGPIMEYPRSAVRPYDNNVAYSRIARLSGKMKLANNSCRQIYPFSEDGEPGLD